ncbi:hypothetical protein J3L16_05450 [Alteromonas sp. 5E99-2]|uniref:hypothetical protein n=1 Tax=Alteromonas sp. 5E99-2 TaxID=2817683 RepID=UPI001A988551|nr:hypothetical protein [Alteromonas sp. 5E99-2]MBO1255132.1 hypothetical protein [Alteromonas sp. 5E99-2]
MKNLSFADRCRVIIAWVLVKCGRLHFDDFSEQELNELISPYLPQEITVDVPIGNATLQCNNATVSLNVDNRLRLHTTNAFSIDFMGNTLYRIHVMAIISASPNYIRKHEKLTFIDLKIDELQWIDDEYTLIKETTNRLTQYSPLAFTASLASPLTSMLNTATAGLSSSAITYLNSIAQNNKQQVLDDHKPAIEQAIVTQLNKSAGSITMDQAIWREYVFSKIGKKVTVEHNKLRFWLS